MTIVHGNLFHHINDTANEFTDLKTLFPCQEAGILRLQQLKHTVRQLWSAVGKRERTLIKKVLANVTKTLCASGP